MPRAIGKLERLCRDRLAAFHVSAEANGGVTPQGYWFDEAAAEHAVEFIQGYLRHHKGEWAGQPFLLEEWERDQIIRPAFGWKKADGTRLFRVLLVEIARKNGKSQLAAAIGLYLMVADNEPGAEVYASATKKDQAKIVHRAAIAMVKASPDLLHFTKIQTNNISCATLGSSFEPLGADSSTLDGLDPHGNIIDELHAHKDRRVVDVLDTAMGARRQPLTVYITTAGTYNPTLPGWQLHRHAVNVLEAGVEDDELLIFICAMDGPEDDEDEGDDWTQPEAWEKANPNIDVAVKRGYLESQCKKAQNQPDFTNAFLRLHCNQWTQQVTRAINMLKWGQCDTVLTREQYEARMKELKGAPCYGGLDLASKLDLAAFVLCFPDWPAKDDWTWLVKLYCPEATIVERSRRDRVPYDAWVRDGWLTATPGTRIDYGFIEADVLQAGSDYQVKEVGFDPWNATSTASRLLDQGVPLVEIRQGFKTLSEPTKELLAQVVDGKCKHGGHPVLRWMANNVATRKDPNENLAPDKDKSGEKIDGIVAGIIAMSRGLVHTEHESVYETRGVRAM